jgi:hypothetical protein
LAAERIPAGCDQLAPVLRAALGGRRQLRRVTRRPGGSKKGVYRAVFDDESTAIDIEGLMYFDAEWEHVFGRCDPAGTTRLLRAPASIPAA